MRDGDDPPLDASGRASSNDPSERWSPASSLGSAAARNDADERDVPALPVALPRPSLSVGEDVGVEDVVLRAEWLGAEKHLRTCPLCGVNPATPRPRRMFVHVPPWIYGTAAFNTLIVVLLYFAVRRRVDGSLPLCDDCARDDRNAQVVRRLSVLGVVVFPTAFALVGAAVAGLTGALYGAAMGTVSGFVGMIAARRRTRTSIVDCRHIDPALGTVTLRTSRQLRHSLRREAPEALADVAAATAAKKPA
jgi:hypothetical protein